MTYIVISVVLKFIVFVSVFGGFHIALISDTTVVRPVTLVLNEVVASGGNDVILTSGRKGSSKRTEYPAAESSTVTSSLVSEVISVRQLLAVWSGGLTKLRSRIKLDDGSKST